MHVRRAILAAWAAVVCIGCASDESGGGSDDDPDRDGGVDAQIVLPDGSVVPRDGDTLPVGVCGDGLLEIAEEACDDGNTAGEDGCSAACRVEAGFSCVQPGAPCVRTCGDGQIGPGENCDDGNGAGGDGCSAACRLETDYVCQTPGMPCVSEVRCGDGVVRGSEQCDDANTDDGDGCSATCQRVEQGWTCAEPGSPCRAAECGDGVIAGREECDTGDGCDDRCRVEPGWVCPDNVCRPTICGDGTTEGSEQCDDQNNRPYDGCYNCQNEPGCTNTGCTAVCGDGIVFPGEACDDGNTQAEDGCSATCTLEQGYACETQTEEPPAQLDIPIIYRDFRGYDVPAAPTNDPPLPRGHIDFQNANGSEKGIVQNLLGADKKPQYAKGDGSSSPTTHGAAAFNQWYNDVPTVNVTVPERLSFGRQPDGSYVFVDTDFFPLDARGWMHSSRMDEPTTRPGGHNFHFTSELRYWFEYQGGERLDFFGDDDVWVFVNGRLAVDLGGVHGALPGFVVLTGSGGRVGYPPSSNPTDPSTSTTMLDFGLQTGRIYEIVVFQAERRETRSEYKLTLRGFEKKRTTCAFICGDGRVTPGEVCDDGENDNSYGSCTTDCQGFGPRCGDGQTQADQGEECDTGVNLGGYGGCASGCKLGPRCGDGNVDGLFGEQCDDGNQDPTDGCDNECRSGTVVI